MTELYWITRLSHLNHMFAAFVGISGTLLIIGIIVFCNASTDDDEDIIKHALKTIKISVLATLFNVLCLVFIPTTSEGLLIFGVGGAIDYIKDNPTAQRLPEKCIQAIDEWVESINKSEKEKGGDRPSALR